MCRLFGMCAGPQPAKATFWLLEAPDSIARQSRREPDGTGLGWFEGDGRPQLSKQPLAAYADRTFGREAKTVVARLFLAHIRFASRGSLTAQNTHPFLQDGRLFAHNGVIEGVSALEERLGEVRTLVQGETDSERFFALITKEARRAGGDLEEGIATATAWIRENLPLLSLNFVLLDRDGLWAFRYPQVHPLFLLAQEGGLNHESSLGSRVKSKGNGGRFVVVASEPLDNRHRWRALRSGELLHVSGDLSVRSRLLFDEPPAKPLTLADLDARARASQAPAAPSA